MGLGQVQLWVRVCGFTGDGGNRSGAPASPLPPPAGQQTHTWPCSHVCFQLFPKAKVTSLTPTSGTREQKQLLKPTNQHQFQVLLNPSLLFFHCHLVSFVFRLDFFFLVNLGLIEPASELGLVQEKSTWENSPQARPGRIRIRIRIRIYNNSRNPWKRFFWIICRRRGVNPG